MHKVSNVIFHDEDNDDDDDDDDEKEDARNTIERVPLLLPAAI